MNTSKFELHQLEFSLNIVTSMPQAISGELLSQGGEIVHIAASVPTVCENQELRPLTRTELEEILFPQSTVTIMRSLPLQKFEVHAPNGTSFTVAETLQAIVDIERTVRPQICWLSGGVIDCHHIFFEGDGNRSNGIISLGWGS